MRAAIDRRIGKGNFRMVPVLLPGAILVLIATIQSTHDERRAESALLKTLGASSLRIVQGLTAEFLALGLVAGLLGAAAATLVAYVLAVAVFDFDYRFNPWLVPRRRLANSTQFQLGAHMSKNGTGAATNHPRTSTCLRPMRSDRRPAP
jgi:predicted lysophospholipase L1 biosynthesis ABC-type transport system permease subunit